MARTPKSIAEVVAFQLCTGCGACSYVEPNCFAMADTLEYGRRPVLRTPSAAETGEALFVCPGAGLAHADDLCRHEGLDKKLLSGWGPIYGVWEGFAADPDIRYAGSSGGAATALALYCLEREGMAGALHTGIREGKPYLNDTVFSASRDDLLVRTGSRYSPASPAEGLDRIEKSGSPCVFIGKPCDVAAAQKARQLRAVLDQKLGLTIAFFCAGVPSLKGNLELLKTSGAESLASVTELRYRGRGWPGLWTVKLVDGTGREELRQMTYADSWGFLQRFRQWRCYICPDHTGEFGDIAVGDPWYRPVQAGEAGKSLIVARTRRGLQIIKAAASAGYLVLEFEDASMLPRSQRNLLASRGNLWARLTLLGMFGVRMPRYRNFATFRYWWSELSAVDKLRSFTSTAKRIFSKKLHRPVSITPWFGDQQS